MPSLSVLDLPVELIVYSLAFLDAKDVLKCSQACRRLHMVVNESIELRYTIELAFDGMQDPDVGSGIGSEFNLDSRRRISDRLDRLRSLRRNWDYLAWTAKHILPIGGRCTAYELVGGMLAKSDGMPLDGSAQFYCLPSVADVRCDANVDHEPVEADRPLAFSRPNNDPCMRDFAIDPSQDLIALLQDDDHDHLCVHVRSITTYKRHPKAAIPTLRHPFRHRQTPLHSVVIQIVDDVVGLFYTTHQNRTTHLLYWNWRTGNVILCPHSISIPIGVTDWAFISNRGFILTCISNNNPHSRTPGSSAEIKVYRFAADTDPPDLRDLIQSLSDPITPDPSASPTSAIPPKCCPSTIALPPLHTATLELPPIRRAACYQHFRTHTGPFTAFPDRTLPFMPRRETQLHVMFVTVRCTSSEPGLEPDDAINGENTRHYVVFVRNDTFLKRLELAGDPLPVNGHGESSSRPFKRFVLGDDPMSDSEDSQTELEKSLDDVSLTHTPTTRIIITSKRTVHDKRSSRARLVKWLNWGTDETRWQQGLWHPRWLRYVHGQRAVFYITPPTNADYTPQPLLLVYDFNGPPTHAGLPGTNMAAANGDGDREVDVDDKREHPLRSETNARTTIIPGDRFFAHDLITSLPYRIMRKRCNLSRSGGNRDIAGVMVDAERIVALEMDFESDFNSGLNGCTILTF